jgi:hypothetical protein
MRTEEDFRKLTDFRISTIKQLIPRWLYLAWKRIADDPDSVQRGWRKCGLRAPFDETKDNVLIKAQLGMSDPDHSLYPLFPNGDRTSLPPEVVQGETETEIGQAGELVDDDAAEHKGADEEDQQTAQRVRALAAADETSNVQRTPAQPVRSGDVALYPLFNIAARRQQA